MKNVYRKACDINRYVLWLFVAFAVIISLLFPLTAHAAADSVMLSLRVGQEFKTNSSASNVSTACSYTLTSLDAKNPMPAGSVNGSYFFTLSGTVTETVGAITFINTGIYKYTVKANTASPAVGYTYDNQIYTVSIYVSRQSDDNLKTEIIVEKSNGTKVNNIYFNHNYTPNSSGSGGSSVTPNTPPSPRPSISDGLRIHLTVSNGPSTDATFLFLLTAQDKNNPMPRGSTNGVKEMEIVGPGEYLIGSWQYVKEGIYYYTINQVDKGEAGYTYDMSVYIISDVVKDINGRLVVTRTVTNGSGKQVQVCTYINKYKENNVVDDKKKPINGGGTTGVNGPKTGDDSLWEFYSFLLAASILAVSSCLFFLLYSYRNNRQRNITAE